MNNFQLYGRITNEVNLNKTKNGLDFVALNLAVEKTTRKDGKFEKGTDFINTICFGSLANTICNFFSKGQRILVEGKITSVTSERGGMKITQPQLNIQKFYFVELRKKEELGKVGKRLEKEGLVSDELDFANLQESYSIPDDFNGSDWI